MWQAIIGSVASKFLSKGLSAAFGEGSQQQQIQRIPVNFQTARTWAPEEAGKADTDFGELEYEDTSYNTHLLAWEKRLFGGENSYTGKITLPKVEV